jgi:hypothetical protein
MGNHFEWLKARLRAIGEEFVRMERESVFESPIPSTYEKYREAVYFQQVMVGSYHLPDNFQFNLNAFVQALRNITFMLQSEENKPPTFNEWYAIKQEEMRKYDLLRRFRDSRNLIVKRQSLKRRSVARVGYFQYRRSREGSEPSHRRADK